MKLKSLLTGILKGLLVEVVALTAPVVCLVYRKGWYLTPDDPVSPFGCGTTPFASSEPFMRKLYERFGRRVGDWWWLGVRNRAYGLAYELKPDHFKRMGSYADDVKRLERRWYGPVRVIEIDGHYEVTVHFWLFHVIAGYRLRPIRDEMVRAVIEQDVIFVRGINMDARPIFSIRWGKRDD